MSFFSMTFLSLMFLIKLSKEKEELSPGAELQLLNMTVDFGEELPSSDRTVAYPKKTYPEISPRWIKWQRKFPWRDRSKFERFFFGSSTRRKRFRRSSYLSNRFNFNFFALNAGLNFSVELTGVNTANLTTLKVNNDEESPSLGSENASTIDLSVNSAKINDSEYERLLINFRALYPTQQWKNCCLYSDEFLKIINPHWLQFKPPDSSSHYILAAIYSIIMVVGIIGNYLVIFMFLRCRSLQTPANILVVNLAVCDSLLLSKMPIFIFNSFHRGPVLGIIGCKIYGFVGGLTGTVSIMSLAAIALDRYLVVVYPLNPFKNTTRRRARFCVAFVWFYGLVFSAIPLFDLGLNRYVPEGYLTACSFDYLATDFKSRLFVLVFFLAAWMVPFTIITFCYVNICCAVSGAASVSRFGQEKEKRRVELRLAIIVIFVIALWFVSWTPYAIVALLGVFGQTQYLHPHISMVPALFCKVASCADPFIYAITHPKFKRELAKLFRRKYIQRERATYRTRTQNSAIKQMQSSLDETVRKSHYAQYPVAFDSNDD